MKTSAIKRQSLYRNYLISGLILLTLLLLIPASTVAKTISSGVNKVTMLELYTSQGCSSCPPAEHWIGKFKNDPKLWQQIVPINFHVDYWDYLGWEDPFASKGFSQRQRRYKQLKHARTVGTPDFIVDGKGWNGWFSKRKYPKNKALAVGVVSVDIIESSQQATVTFSPIEKMANELEVHVAILGFGLSTDVSRGENSGKQLKHDFVVLGYRHQKLSLQNNIATAQLSLPDVSRFNASQQAVVVWVSNRDDPTPIQVAADWL